MPAHICKHRSCTFHIYTMLLTDLLTGGIFTCLQEAVSRHAHSRAHSRHSGHRRGHAAGMCGGRGRHHRLLHRQHVWGHLAALPRGAGECPTWDRSGHRHQSQSACQVWFPFTVWLLVVYAVNLLTGPARSGCSFCFLLIDTQ